MSDADFESSTQVVESVGKFSINESKTILKKDELRWRSIIKPEKFLKLKHVNTIVIIPMS